jgi:hypothetical protein
LRSGQPSLSLTNFKSLWHIINSNSAFLGEDCGYVERDCRMNYHLPCAIEARALAKFASDSEYRTGEMVHHTIPFNAMHASSSLLAKRTVLFGTKIKTEIWSLRGLQTGLFFLRRGRSWDALHGKGLLDETSPLCATRNQWWTSPEPQL